MTMHIMAQQQTVIVPAGRTTIARDLRAADRAAKAAPTSGPFFKGPTREQAAEAIDNLFIALDTLTSHPDLGGFELAKAVLDRYRAEPEDVAEARERREAAGDPDPESVFADLDKARRARAVPDAVERPLRAPYVGAMVWYWPHGQQDLNDGVVPARIKGVDQPLAAVVTAVWTPERVNLIIFAPVGATFVRASVLFVQEAGAAAEGVSIATWPRSA